MVLLLCADHWPRLRAGVSKGTLTAGLIIITAIQFWFCNAHVELFFCFFAVGENVAEGKVDLQKFIINKVWCYILRFN